MQSVSSDYFDYYFGWENSRMGSMGMAGMLTTINLNDSF